MNQLLSEFAEQYRLRVRRDECGDAVIGKSSHIFEGYQDRLGVCLLFTSPRKWSFAKKRLQSAGLVLRQDGDTEGILTFDPSEAAQARAAIRAAGVRPRRTCSPQQLESLAKARTLRKAA